MLTSKLRFMIVSCCLAAASASGMTACKKNSDPDQSQASDAAAIRDMKSSENIGGDRFKVICKNGDRETRTADQIADQEVCEGRHPRYPYYEGTYGNAPAVCAGDAIMRGFSPEQATQLCTGARDKSPAVCAGDAIMRGFSQDRAIRLCRPQSIHAAPYPPGHGGYPRPFPYN
jgi:hypothetical protein